MSIQRLQGRTYSSSKVVEIEIDSAYLAKLQAEVDKARTDGVVFLDYAKFVKWNWTKPSESQSNDHAFWYE